jgi:hypothetical protein
MANLIQATVYQIDGSPLPASVTLDFQTSNLVIREATVSGFSAINSAILYYNVPNNQLSVQTFYVGEEIADLVAAANVGTTTQLQATVTEINEDPQVPGGVQYSFPANEILIGSDYIQFKATKYTVSELQSDLLVSGNGASAYKVYTALLTQSGSDGSNQFISSGSLTIGVTYLIDEIISGTVDFTNVGAPNNNVGTYFVATGTTPNSWGEDASLAYVTAAPVVTVLENTIGNIWFTYLDVGQYVVNCDGLFTADKTTVCINALPLGRGDGSVASIVYQGNSSLQIETGTLASIGIDGTLFNTPIEIRVYN